MTLDNYLIKFKITSLQFAKKVGVSHSAVSKWRIRNRTPGLKMMSKIEKITKKRVSIADWIQ